MCKGEERDAGEKGGGEIAGGSEHARQELFVGHFMYELETEVE